MVRVVAKEGALNIDIRNEVGIHDASEVCTCESFHIFLFFFVPSLSALARSPTQPDSH